jgi:hypothetical protein
MTGDHQFDFCPTCGQVRAGPTPFGFPFGQQPDPPLFTYEQPFVTDFGFPFGQQPDHSVDGVEWDSAGGVWRGGPPHQSEAPWAAPASRCAYEAGERCDVHQAWHMM